MTRRTGRGAARAAHEWIAGAVKRKGSVLPGPLPSPERKPGADQLLANRLGADIFYYAGFDQVLPEPLQRPGAALTSAHAGSSKAYDRLSLFGGEDRRPSGRTASVKPIHSMLAEPVKPLAYVDRVQLNATADVVDRLPPGRQQYDSSAARNFRIIRRALQILKSPDLVWRQGPNKNRHWPLLKCVVPASRLTLQMRTQATTKSRAILGRFDGRQRQVAPEWREPPGSRVCCVLDRNEEQVRRRR